MRELAKGEFDRGRVTTKWLNRDQANWEVGHTLNTVICCYLPAFVKIEQSNDVKFKRFI
jgi:hypothetical protein